MPGPVLARLAQPGEFRGMTAQQVVEKLRLLLADELDFIQPSIDGFGFVSFQIRRRRHALAVNVKVPHILQQLRLHGRRINRIATLHF